MFVAIGNTPRDYAWGSSTAIAEFRGVAPSGGPEAELWLGAHAGSPAQVSDAASVGHADLAPGPDDLHHLQLRGRQPRLLGLAHRFTSSTYHLRL